jgi:Fe-S-cluster formation regulator IscX/YfhJ
MDTPPCGILRTKEILGDILSSTTGMNRGRLRWEDMKKIQVPLRGMDDDKVKAAVKTLEAFWAAYDKMKEVSRSSMGKLSNDLKLEGEDSRLRWLAYKPPE